MKKEIELNNEPLEKALQVINNYFRTDVSVENQEMLKCNVQIPKLSNPDLETALDYVVFQLTMEKDTVGNRLVLKGGESCNNN